ncbi:hypothetical protein [Enterococcus sp. CSURQ0835]|uniref:hypothetical protein n=1 Tax=Enterococcus sp. CSURQ0835 TaxID=2681394 RepID=UPI00135C8A46|nr:hypothetical protein [Enterococcus sp. CSURQ0835]
MDGFDWLQLIIVIFIILFWLVAAGLVIYLVFHPALIGEYIGKIMDGIKSIN